MSTVIGTETITKNPAFGTQFWSVRFNQYKVETADGGWVVYDNGPTLIEGILLLKNVSKTESDDLRTFLTGTAVYQKTSFIITPPSATDLGKGDGAAITVFYSGGPDLQGVFNFIPPGRNDIKIPYREKVV